MMEWVYSTASSLFGLGRKVGKRGATFLALALASSNLCLLSKGNDWFPAPHAQVTFSRERLHGHYMSSVRLAKKHIAKKLKELEEQLEALIPIPSPADIKNAEKEDRRALWNQMLHGFFARTLASVYCVCVLSISHQMSWVMLGKYMALRTLFAGSPLVVKEVELSEDQQAGFSNKMTETVVKSFPSLVVNCLQVAKEVLAGVSLKERWGAEEVTGFITAIRHRLEETQPGNKPWYFDSLFPEGRGTDKKVELLVNEARNTIHHHKFGEAISIALEGLFASVLDQMESSVFSEPVEPKGTIVAALLPKLKKFGDTIVYSPDFFPKNIMSEVEQSQDLSSPFGPVQVQRRAADCVLMSTHFNWFLFEELFSDIPDSLAVADS